LLLVYVSQLFLVASTVGTHGQIFLPVAYIATAPRQHSHFWFRIPSGYMTRIFVLSWTCTCLEVGPPFNERRGRTTTGHSPSAGSDSNLHSLTNWPSPTHTHTHTHTPAYVPTHSHTHSCTHSLSLSLTHSLSLSLTHAHTLSCSGPIGPCYVNHDTDHIGNTISSNSSVGACVSIATGTHLLSHCQAVDVSSGSTILAFGHHVTINIQFMFIYVQT
jgi:hypothetical protein